MNVALVHDSLVSLGGAERVLEELTRVFPDAPVYVLERTSRHRHPSRMLSTSFLQRVPRLFGTRRWAFPLYAVAPETFDLSAYDVVLSSCSAFAKGVVTRPGSLHICYCHAPARFLWDATHETVDRFPAASVKRGVLRLALHALRIWDVAASRRVDVFIANSETTRSRIRKFYGRDAAVIYPPVATERFAQTGTRAGIGDSNGVHRGYFLFVGRLSPYKNAELVVETFRKLGLPLVVVGEGRAERRVRQAASPAVIFRGFVPDEALADLYAHARAVIFPSDDDFGLVPIEAMASGTPVLALRRGGAVETVEEGVTGEFFDEPLEELLADCVRRFLEREQRYSRVHLRAFAERFSRAAFRSAIRDFVTQAWEERRR